ncbi:MAG: polymerase subfamily sigma factor [Herbinix sp.]|nr:polymerase subfamily sigma factor [Herbinix sp.]
MLIATKLTTKVRVVYLLYHSLYYGIIKIIFHIRNKFLPLLTLIDRLRYEKGKPAMKHPDEKFITEFDKIKEQLYRIAYLYLKSESSALEAVDETVFLAYKNLRKLRQPQYFKTWITRILINVCKKELRRLKKEAPLDTLPEQTHQDYDALPLKDAITKLPEELQIIINLRYFNDFTVVETANILKLPQGTVATRQRKALSILRLEMEVE